LSKDNYLLDELIKIECPDSTARLFPALVYHKGKGSIIYDGEGRGYIDLSSGFSTLAIGHNHPYVQKAVLEYMAENGVVHGLGDVYASKPKIEFFEKLKTFLPEKFDTFSLAVTGSQAVELALKTSLLRTKRSGVICLRQGYHGLDMGAMVLTGMKKFSDPFLEWGKNSHVTHIDSGEDLFSIEQKILEMRASRKEVGSIILEPILGRFGGKPHPEGWLKALYSLAKKYGIIVIFDEIYTGLGRTGVSFRAEIEPCDIICVGKAIGGGMPLSAVCASKEIMAAWPESRGEAIHTGTFFGHPLSCLYGKLTLDVIQNECLIDRSKTIGDKALEYLKARLYSGKCAEIVTDVRGNGLMISVEFNRPLFGVELMNRLRAEGVVLIPSGSEGKSIAITPALNIPEGTLFKALDKVVQVCDKLI